VNPFHLLDTKLRSFTLSALSESPTPAGRVFAATAGRPEENLLF